MSSNPLNKDLPLRKSFKDNLSLNTAKAVSEAIKISMLLHFDLEVNLSLEDRLKLSPHFEWDEFESTSYLSLKRIVPSYAIKSNSMLRKQSDTFIEQKQLRHAQKIYEKISKQYNTYPYGKFVAYNFEPWTNNTYRCNILVKYRTGIFHDEGPL